MIFPMGSAQVVNYYKNLAAHQQRPHQEYTIHKWIGAQTNINLTPIFWKMHVFANYLSPFPSQKITFPSTALKYSI